MNKPTRSDKSYDCEMSSQSRPMSKSARQSNDSNTNANASSQLNRRSSIECIRQTLNRQNISLSVAQVNIMLTKMVFIICTFSALEHISLIMSLQMFTDFVGAIKLDMIFLFNVCLLVKHSSNVFIFYYFNDFFRKRFNKLISQT